MSFVKSIPRYRPTWVEISRGAFASNVRQLKSHVGSRVKILAVMKADAYGHGASSLASIALKNGASTLGVSSVEEGLSLRSAGIHAPILILGGVFPFQNLPVAVKSNLLPTAASFESAQQLKKLAKRLKKKISFHLKIDTGMGRIGISPSGAKPLLEWIRQQKEIVLTGVYSHFACADSDSTFTAKQLSMFAEIQALVKELGFKKVVFHMANSAATLNHRPSHLDMVRPGLALYGESLTSIPAGVTLRPVLSWKSQVIFLKRVPPGTSISYGRTMITQRETQIATVPVGYADGVPRQLSNKGYVLVQGHRRPIIGRVTMDHTMVDVTGLSLDTGEEVVLIGQQLNSVVSASEFAGWASTIPYEIFCGISKRVPRELVA